MFPGETVLLSVIRPVPRSLKVIGVSSHPGEVGVSDSLGNLVLFAEVLDGGKFTTEFGSARGSSFGPGLLGREELVVEFVVAEGLGVGVR